MSYALQKTLPYRNTNNRADDGAGDEIRKPVDVGGNANADIKSVGNAQKLCGFIFWVEGKNSHGHGKRHGGVAGRPTPKHSPAPKTKPKHLRNIRKLRAHTHGRAGPAGE